MSMSNPSEPEIDLEELFPDLAPVLSQWDQSGNEPPGGGVDGSEGTEPLDVEPEGSEPPTSPPVEESDEPPAPPAEPESAPTSLSDAEVAQLVAFRDELRENPELASLVSNYFAGQQPPAPAPESSQPVPPEPTAPASPALTPPPDLDLDDPAIKAVWEANVANHQRIAQLESMFQVQQQQARLAQSAQSESFYNRATESFRQSHNLEKSDIDRISQVAARMGVLPSLMSGVDPITGLPSRPDPLTALDRALQIAYDQLPEYHPEQTEKNTQRKQRLAAVSGRSGSVPRATPVPTDAAGKTAMLITEVASMLNGSWSEPESN